MNHSNNRIKNKRINLLSLFLLFISSSVFAQNLEENKADSIISEVLKYGKIYEHYIEKYDARLYLKGSIEVKKKNGLFQYAPDFFYLNKEKDYSFFESIIELNYKAPDYFVQNITAINGDKINTEDIQQRLPSFLGINIYNSTLFNEHILLLSPKSIFRYYSFEHIDTSDTLTRKIHKIKITPKIRSQKLISGYLYVVDKIGSIYKIDINGRREFSDFQVRMEFGLPGNDFLLPINYNLIFRLNLFGNQSIHNYSGQMQYNSIQLHEWKEEEKSFNLSNYYSSKDNSAPIVKDSFFWENERAIPLSERERFYLTNPDTLKKQTFIQNILNNSSGIFTPRKTRHNNTTLFYSGLLNPLRLSYTKVDGIAYWQQLRLSNLFNNAQKFQINPSVGFLLQRQETYFEFPIRWTFAPEKFGSVNFTFRNNNKSFNSSTFDKINRTVLDSINFKDFNIDYYHHYHLGLSSRYEITNGLIIRGGINYDWYSPVKKHEDVDVLLIDNDRIDWVSDNYHSTSPVVSLRWTPGQYYWFNGKEKEYLNSRYPSFSVEYSRGIPGIFKSHSDYERIEIDMQQKIPINLMHSIHYYIGTGWFTNTESVYFADFKKFRRKNTPESWDDPLGGAFHLLDRNWYNASNYYFQAHFMYESPFALLQLFKNVSKDILQERIYIGQLYTPVLPCYTEIGYGFGNFFGDIGVFVSLNRGEPNSFGAKFTFDFNK